MTVRSSFCRINRLLTAYLGHNEITVSVESQGTYWDTILDLDASPKRIPGGYVCDFCPAQDRPVFPSPEALWRDHLFEPFLEWINNDLAKADAISITGTPDWIGSARLITG